MSGIRVQADWITGYAKTVERAADELTAALTALDSTPLGATAFGQLGKTTGAPEAYGRASTALQQQAQRAADALRSAAGNLRTIATTHSSLDEDQAAALSKVHRS
jgi:uncharacterized protein YukE